MEISNAKWLVVVAALALMMPNTEATVPCNVVVRNLMPCVNYVVNGGTVSYQCCTGINALYAAARNRGDRQDVCRCLKQSISRFAYNSANVANAARLPAMCGVNLPYNISPNFNCATVA